MRGGYRRLSPTCSGLISFAAISAQPGQKLSCPTRMQHHWSWLSKRVSLWREDKNWWFLKLKNQLLSRAVLWTPLKNFTALLQTAHQVEMGLLPLPKNANPCSQLSGFWILLHRATHSAMPPLFAHHFNYALNTTFLQVNQLLAGTFS